MENGPENTRSTVPKFASFRPKPVERFNEDKDTKNHSDHELRRSDTRRKKRNAERKEIQSKDEAFPPRHSDKLASDGQLFAVDRFGDVKNIEFGSLHSYAVPLHFRSGSGRVIGLSSKRLIDRKSSTENSTVILDVHESRDSHRQRYLLAHENTLTTETITPSISKEGDEDADLQNDFVSFWSTTGKKRKRSGEISDGGSTSQSEEDSNAYRFPNPPKATQDEENDQTGQSTAVAGSESSRQNIALQENAKLQRVVDQDQSSFPAWMDLISHQDNMVKKDTSGRRFTNAEMRSTSDIKLSMYEKAANKIAKDNPNYPTLLLSMMQECEKLWSPKKLQERWQSLIHDNPDILELWSKYIDFRQSNASAFEFDEIRSTYTECIAISTKRLQQLRKDGSDIRNSVVLILYLLLRGTIFLKDSGYSETAIAIWKALLQYNFLENDNKCGEPNDDLKNLEAFWESEDRRIGETSIEGPLHDPQPLPISMRSPFESWSVAELAAEHESPLPARTIDEVLENDPYRVILFSDIKDWMVRFDTQDSWVIEAILNSFCEFCNLPPISAELNHGSNQGSSDQFVRTSDFLSLDLEYTSPFNFDLPRFLPSINMAIAEQGTWFSQWAPNERIEEWKTTTMKELFQKGIGGSNFAAYVIALEFATQSNRTRATAKAALKRHPTSLGLYNTYALITCRQKGVTEASKIFLAAIGLAETVSQAELFETIDIQASWIQELLLAKDYKTALDQIFTIKLSHIIGPVTDLEPFAKERKERGKYFVSALSRLVAQTKCEAALAMASIYVYHQYLTPPGQEISRALAACREVEPLLSSGRAIEKLHQTLAQLIHHHVLTDPTHKPKEIRSALFRSATLFPQNSIFLSLLFWHSRRFGLEDRIRDAMQSVLSSQEKTQPFQPKRGLVNATFSIYRELHRSSGLSTNAVQDAFEQAVEFHEGPARHSVPVWDAYVRFAAKELGVAKARDVFFRALRATPWSKRIYMLAFGVMSKVLSRKETEGVWKTMDEKGLRLRVDLSEILED